MIWLFLAGLFAILIIGLIIWCVYDANYHKTRKIADYITEATIALVLATIILGFFQIYSKGEEDKAKFLLDLKQSFYCGNETNRKIIKAIENNNLEILTQEANIKIRALSAFTEYEIDEYIINFDYMNIFINRTMLDEKDVNQVFGWYIRKAWNNREMQNYIKRIRKEEKDVYSNFENLAIKMRRYK